MTSVVTSTAGTRPLAVKVADTGEAAGEKTTKRISRQNLHRRLRRLGRKLDDVRVHEHAVVEDLALDVLGDLFFLEFFFSFQVF